MKIRKWQPEEDELIREKYLTMSYVDIGKELGRPPKQIAWRARDVLGLVKPPEQWRFKTGHRAHNKGTKKWEVSAEDLRKFKTKGKWLPEEEQFLIANYRTMSRGEMAFHLKRTSGAINARMVILSINKVEQDGLFKKGGESWNKGLKMMKATGKNTAIPVKINDKTTIFVNDVNKIERVKEKYEKHINIY